ncbi:FAD/FMN-containing dehydrogenase [Rubrobacter radiotolerans]|uniref:FAD-binding oxidoreductase n=1 Tax=Rubrobacter radiotolerans TaxID=42256 RepID=A0A023X6D9_RUBRA|nr:FAD-binding oxidoreductase [Rubrobacter radiotolerans]AHY47545.1 FAD/FMN-containing dehydrogenase [Rubrobacter radiotolerans]MDX5894948.1 FAD-binding oxidoreductase [Rubrobacter radiotolerans]SMC07134.1 glycolate oxidase FAD binding subunit [Rubrobacter radiotolerans DSM 5868]
METKLNTEGLQGIVGEANVREATEEDRIDGVQPHVVVEPGTEEEVAEVLKFARSEGVSVAPRGGGTKMGWGNIPAAAEIVLDMRRMGEIVEHVPGDQVVRVQAGAKLSYVQQSLFRSNQMIALDPPSKLRDATVGGIIATNDSGPRRYKYNTTRDLIIGARIVLADGTISKSGGKVVKNVAGYDLGKLFTGSLGTLGVIVSANFRLHPLPEAARTVAVEVETPKAARDAMMALWHSQVEASAIELHWGREAKLVSALLESIPEGVEAKEEQTRLLFRPFGEVRSLTDEEYDDLGPYTRPDGSGGEVVIKAAAPPAELDGLIEVLENATERRGIEADLRGHAASGIVFSGLVGEEDAVVEAVEEAREILVRRGGSLVVREAPVSFKRRVDAWGPAGDYLELTRRVKEKFDAAGTLNPGRYLGGM